MDSHSFWQTIALVVLALASVPPGLDILFKWRSEIRARKAALAIPDILKKHDEASYNEVASAKATVSTKYTPTDKEN